MKRLISALFVVPALLVAASLTWAHPSDPTACVDCHTTDPAVVVTVTSLGCYWGDEAVRLQVSNTYPGVEGWGVFDGPTKINSNYGNWATVTFPSYRTYTLYGVSSFASSTVYPQPPATSNSVDYASNCPPYGCNDTDGDTFSVDGGPCGLVDCNDNDATVYPDAAEVVRDGIDQNCNGYDLTIIVSKATYSTRTRKLTVEASSLHGSSANLSVVNFGQMNWNSKKKIWTLTVVTSSNPGTVTVSGFEGSTVATVQ